MIRKQLAVRFAVAALFGSVAGILLAVGLNGKFFSLIFTSFGIYNQTFSIGTVSALIPIPFMTVRILEGTTGEKGGAAHTDCGVKFTISS